MRGMAAVPILIALASPAFLSAAAGSPLPSASTTPAAAQAAIVRLERIWLAHEKDPNVVDAILADDFVHVLPAGLISKQEHLDYLRAHPDERPITRRFEKLQVRVYGKVAIANGIFVAAPGRDGRADRTLFTDVFVFRRDRWRAVNAQESPAASSAKP